jgi:2-phosphosulfolactate phosphatase
VAEAAKKRGDRIIITPTGERWPDDTSRPAFEDLIGAAEPDLTELILRCGSGIELGARVFSDAVLLASQLNVSDGVPILQEGAFCTQLVENS